MGSTYETKECQARTPRVASTIARSSEIINQPQPAENEQLAQARSCVNDGRTETQPTSQSIAARHSRRNFEPDDTLVLLGLDDAGEKTLGLMAAIALRRTLVVFDEEFKRANGQYPETFILSRGIAKLCEAELSTAKQLFDLNTRHKGFVICGSGRLLCHQLRKHLSEFSTEYPVVYIRRDLEDYRQQRATEADRSYQGSAW